MNMRGPFRVLHTQTVYKNPWISVREDRVIRPDGKKGIFGITSVIPGITVVPIDKKGFCYLGREYAYAHHKVLLQLPAGGIDKGETPIRAAKRELLEEMGLTARKWKYLGTVAYYTTVFYTREYLFLARGVAKVKEPSAEEKRLIAPVRIPFKEALRLAAENKIQPAESIAAIFRADYYLTHSRARQKKTHRS